MKEVVEAGDRWERQWTQVTGGSSSLPVEVASHHGGSSCHDLPVFSWTKSGSCLPVPDVHLKWVDMEESGSQEIKCLVLMAKF